MGSKWGRFGVEMGAPLESQVLLVRFGIWVENDHRIRFEAEPNAPEAVRNLETAYPDGRKRMHTSLGAGLIFSDLAAIDVTWESSSQFAFKEFFSTSELPEEETKKAGQLSLTTRLRF